jgi:hypothetical protein
MSDLVREFLVRSLTAAGGIVEDVPGGLEALLPIDAASELKLPEELRIQFAGPEAPAVTGAVDGRLGSSLLESLSAARLERTSVAAIGLPAGLPAPLPDTLLVLRNAIRAGVPERRRVTDRYVVLDVRLTLHGEEFRSVVLSLTVRLHDATCTVPFHSSGAYPVRAAPLDDSERRRVAAALRTWLRREGPVHHAVALETVRRRARRDLERMADYYAGLDAEMAKAVQRARSPDERARRAAKWAALPTDLEARRTQLRARIRPRLAARILAATIVQTDVERFVFTVRRRNREGTVTVYHRTSDGTFEGPACASCGQTTLAVDLCDDHLHILCAACGRSGKLDAARCPACRGESPQPPLLAIEDATARLHLGGAAIQG